MNNRRFVMDLARCTGCLACQIACKDRADLPDDLDWLRIEVHEQGRFPETTLFYRIMHCFHCAEAPCLSPCPTQAINRTDQGWVQIDGALCIGCGACLEACPFGAIVLSPEGVASKCDACTNELARGDAPTCVRACPMRALDLAKKTKALPPLRVEDDRFDDGSIGPQVVYLRRP